jgi:hypothetical protein
MKVWNNEFENPTLFDGIIPLLASLRFKQMVVFTKATLQAEVFLANLLTREFQPSFQKRDRPPNLVSGTNGTVRLGSERKFSSGTWKIFVILPRALAIDDDFKNLPWLKSRTFLASAN